MLYTAFALLTGRTHKFDLQTVQNNGTGENEIIYIPMFYLLDEIANIGIFILGGTKHENTIWFYFDQ